MINRLAIGSACALGAFALSTGTAMAEFPSASACLPRLKLKSGWCGDGGQATRALLYMPAAVAAWADGSFVVMDSGPTVRRDVRLAVVRRVAADGTITVAAGTGREGSTGDGGPATAARVTEGALATLPDGGFLLAETLTHRVRRVWPDGRITTVAGVGREGFSGDGGPAIAAQLARPTGLAATADGGFLIADAANARVRRVAPDGTISTVAGDGRRDTHGDWGQATAAGLRAPIDVAVLPGGGFVIIDQGLDLFESTLLKVVLPSGDIFTHRSLVDFVSSCVCALRNPQVAVLRDASVQIALSDYIESLERDQENERVAGSPTCGDHGDGGPAKLAAFSGITDIASIPGGGVLVADQLNSRVRRIDAGGKVTTVAGGGGRAAPRARAAARICMDPITLDPYAGFTILLRSKVPSRTLAVTLQTPIPGNVVFKISKGKKSFKKTFPGGGTDRVTLGRSLPPGDYRVTATQKVGSKTLFDERTVKVTK